MPTYRSVSIAITPELCPLTKLLVLCVDIRLTMQLVYLNAVLGYGDAGAHDMIRSFLKMTSSCALG